MSTFDKNTLEQKKLALAESFTKIQGEIKQIENTESTLSHRKQELNVELFRLQGENRLVDELLSGDQPVESPESPEAVTP